MIRVQSVTRSPCYAIITLEPAPIVWKRKKEKKKNEKTSHIIVISVGLYNACTKTEYSPNQNESSFACHLCPPISNVGNFHFQPALFIFREQPQDGLKRSLPLCEFSMYKPSTARAYVLLLPRQSRRTCYGMPSSAYILYRKHRPIEAKLAMRWTRRFSMQDYS